MVTYGHRDGTFGSLTGRYVLVIFDSMESPKGGWAMKFVHLCYAALGVAVARWIFKRQPVRLPDPVTRLRTSGLL
jgi:hypothetical protein